MKLNLPSTLTTSSITTSTNSLTPTSSPNDHLLEKIAIPVGTVTGTSLLTGLTYYYCKKRKSKNKDNQEIADNNLKTEAIELKEEELPKTIEDLDTIKTEIQEVNEETNPLTTLTPPVSPSTFSSNSVATSWLHQLLQILTMGEITLLLENQTVNNQVRSPQTEYYIQAIEEIHGSQTEYIQEIQEARSPQVIRYGSPQYWS